MNVLAMIATLGFAILMTAAYGYKVYVRPKHIFLAVQPGAGIQPLRLKKIPPILTYKRPDGSRVKFPMVSSFGEPRPDGKGMVYTGNVATGQLMRFQPDGSTVSAHGIYLENALADGRETRLVSALRGSGITLKHIMIVMAIMAGLLVVVVFLVAKGQGG